MPEWSNGTDSKSVVRFLCTGGSNPSFSALMHGILIYANPRLTLNQGYSSVHLVVSMKEKFL